MNMTDHKPVSKSRIGMNTNKSFEIQLDDGRVRIINDGMTRIAIDLYVWLILVCGGDTVVLKCDGFGLVFCEDSCLCWLGGQHEELFHHEYNW